MSSSPALGGEVKYVRKHERAGCIFVHCCHWTADAGGGGGGSVTAETVAVHHHREHTLLVKLCHYIAVKMREEASAWRVLRPIVADRNWALLL